VQVLRVPTGLPVGEFENLHVGVEIHRPAADCENLKNTVFVCLPGGGMRRQFFDLPVPGDRSFSFTQAMTQQGYTCVLMDHPGVGESDQPDDGYLLNAALLAQAHAAAFEALRRLLPELQGARSIGVGHSMGAMITLLQQATYAQHTAILLLGFGFDGLPQYLSKKAQALLADPEALQAAIPDLARRMFRVDYPVIRSGGNGGGIYSGANAERASIEGIKAVSTHLLPVPAFTSMLPNYWNAEAAHIDVPVLVALGDKDLVKAPDNAAGTFAASPAVEVMVLPQTGHSQFLFPSRTDLFAKIGQWAGQL
jgi:pimeloyl-ACP methyl ester carboxylesterase